MARETAAQRDARMVAEREARLAAERESYPARLMAVLERVSNQYELELKVKEGLFVVTDRNDRYSYSDGYLLSYSWSTDAQPVLENMEWKLDALEAEQAEARRRVEVKKEAERKLREVLSEEERELLGL